MNHYIYAGPVFEFDRCVNYRWKGETFAISEAKARSNLAYQYKKQHKLKPATVIKITGKLELVKEKEVV